MKTAIFVIPLAGCVADLAGNDFDPGKGDGAATATLAASWSVEKLATGEVTGCPAGFGVVALLVADVDTEGRPGKPIRELFDCAEGRGSLKVQQGTVDVWLEIRDDQSMVFASSPVRRLELTQDEATLAETIFEDAGYFGITWQLRDGATKSIVECAAVPGLAAIEAVIATGFEPITERFACDAGPGITRALPTGAHTISLRAVDEAGAVIGTGAMVEQTIQPLNKVTSVGPLAVPITR